MKIKFTLLNDSLSKPNQNQNIGPLDFKLFVGTTS